jgi:type II secretory pathway pseudopilin PulG
LIEFIGVLGVLAIMAAALAPAVIKRMDLAAFSAETATLNSMKNALAQYILQSNTIPSQTNWARAVGPELGLATVNITTTPRNIRRAFLIDTNGWLGTISLPYVQQPGGVPSGQQPPGPSNSRLMIVSSIGKALPISSGAPGTAAFSDIWNTSWPNVPSTWSSWSGNGADLVIQRINLEPLFHRVILVNSAGGPGYFSVGSFSPPDVVPGTAGSGTNTYYLDGTALNLYDNTGTNLIVREIIRADMSRVFENGLWRNSPNLGITNLPPPGLSLGSIAAIYSTNSAGPASTEGATPQSALAAMIAYMDAYTMWANMTPCFSYNSKGNGNSASDGKFPLYQILTPSNNKGASAAAGWIGYLSP